MKKSFSIRTIILAGSLLLQMVTLCFQSHGAAGDVDLSFDPGSGVNGPVQAVAVQPDGKVIIGGEFTTVKRSARFKLARLNADGSDDSSFNPGTVIGATVLAVALQPDGKVLVGHGGGISRHNSDGTPDSSFDSTYAGTGPNGAVSSIALQPDGKVLIGGYFTTVNGTNRNHIARLDANGSLDDSFNPGTGADHYVFSVALQSDGKVLIGGYFNTVNGTNRSRLARLNANGSLDSSFIFNPSFNPGAGYDNQIYSLASQSDGRVLVGGYFGSIDGTNRGRIARLNVNGSLDSTFKSGSGADGSVRSLGLQPDGKVLIGGDFTTVNGTNRNGIARLNANGSLDSSFNPGTGVAGAEYPSVLSLAVRTNGQVFIGGNFTVVGGTSRDRMARLNADGGLDSSFNPGAGVNNSIAYLAVQPNGKVLIAGEFWKVQDLDRLGIARLNADGSGDSSFDAGTTFGSVNFFALQPDGKVILGGPMPRLNPNGSREGSFHPELLFGVVTPSPYDSAGATTVALQPDGKILVGVTSYLYYGCDYEGCSSLGIRYSVARLNADGSRDTNFIRGGVAGQVSSIAVQPDGKVLIGGSFSTVAGTNRSGIARLDTDGSLDNSFNPGTGPDSGVTSVVSQPDGRVLIGGYFTTVNGTNRNNIARLNANGSLDSSFNPATVPNGVVRSIALQPDGKVLIGGDFAIVNGTNRPGIARLNANGSLDNSFNSGTGADGNVSSIALQSDGSVLIAGDFTTVNGVVRPHVARLYGDSAAPSLNIARSNAFVIVSWPSPSTGFVLQQNTDLNPTNWTAPSETVTPARPAPPGPRTVPETAYTGSSTFTGVRRSMVVPSPSWPSALYPQHCTPPLLSSAQA